MKVFVVVYFISLTVILMIMGPYAKFEEGKTVEFLLIIFFACGLPMTIYLIGAQAVCKVLEEREVLLIQLENTNKA